MWPGAICRSMLMWFGQALCARTIQEHEREQGRPTIVFVHTAWFRKHVIALAGIQTYLSLLKTRKGCSGTERLSKAYPDTPSTIVNTKTSGGHNCTENAPTSGPIAYSIRTLSVIRRRVDADSTAITWQCRRNGTQTPMAHVCGTAPHKCCTLYPLGCSKMSLGAFRHLVLAEEQPAWHIIEVAYKQGQL